MKPVALGLLAIFGLAACAFSPSKPPNSIAQPASADKASELAAEQQRMRDVIVFASRHWGHGLAELREVIAASTFTSLSVDDQFEALTLAARAAGETEPKLAYQYLDRAVALAGMPLENQLTTLGLAVDFEYGAAAVNTMTSVARQWPGQIERVDPQLIIQVLRLALHGSRHDRLSVLQALYAAHWKLHWGIEPSSSWRDLALLLVEHGSLREAIDVSTHITDAYVLIAMRADRRFDAVVAALPEQFNVEAAADRETHFYQSLSEEHPKSLALRARVLEALQHEQHYAAMLADADSVVQDIRSTNSPDKLYDDYVEQHAAYFYLRSVALQRAGRWDEAGAQFVEAAREGDINQLINLALFYCALNRPQDALAIVTTIGPARTSPYGAMQIEMVTLLAAVQLGDHDQVSRSLHALSSHYADDPRAYLDALVASNQLDLAARKLVDELEDKSLRESILVDVQEYSPTPEPDVEMQFDSRWRSIVARKEVQAAIRQVGRVESYHLEAP